MLPSGDDAQLQAFARTLLEHVKSGASTTTLDRYFMAAVQQFAPNLVRGATGGTVGATINNIWLAWRNAGHPATADGVLAVLRRFLATRAWFPLLVAAYGTASSTTPAITAPNAGTRPRVTAPGLRTTFPGLTAPPPPPDDGGGFGLLVGVGLALKFLL